MDIPVFTYLKVHWIQAQQDFVTFRSFDMIAKLVLLSLLVFATFKWLPLIHCYLPNSTVAVENLASAIKNHPLA